MSEEIIRTVYTENDRQNDGSYIQRIIVKAGDANSRIVEIWGVRDGKDQCIIRTTVAGYRCGDLAVAFKVEQPPISNEQCYQCDETATEQLPGSNAFPDAHIPLCPAHAEQRRAEMVEAGMR